MLIRKYECSDKRNDYPFHGFVYLLLFILRHIVPPHENMFTTFVMKIKVFVI